MKSALPVLIFSDLDGTLLDHDTYAWDAATPALAQLRALGGGLVLASSKTAAEIHPLRSAMEFKDWPAIVENGAGVLAAGAEPEEVNGSYAALRKVLKRMPSALRQHCKGFGDMSTDEITAVTGLKPEDATRAKARAFSEPCLWYGDDATLAEFNTYLAGEGVNVRRGGRFLTLSFGRTKASAMAQIIDDLAPVHTIALGDAPNDIEMLHAADTGIIIANPNHSSLPRQPGEETGQIIRTTLPGPQGWNGAVCTLLSELQTKGPSHGRFPPKR